MIWNDGAVVDSLRKKLRDSNESTFVGTCGQLDRHCSRVGTAPDDAEGAGSGRRSHSTISLLVFLPRTGRRSFFNISKLISGASVVVSQIELISLEVIKLTERKVAHVLKLAHYDSRSNSQLGCELNNRIVIPWPTTKEMAHFLTWY
jgi:hypothetical protein